MINLYLIDYYSQRNSGLTTYVDQLQAYLRKDERVRVHFILVKATGYPSVQVDKHQSGIKYYVPYDIGNSTHPDQDRQLLDCLRKDILDEQIIFHFNWINHAPFAQVLKKAFSCKIVLTKHCIPWRDFITTNYPLFRTLNRQILIEEKPVYLDGTLIRELLAYQAVDHTICVTQLAQSSLDRLFGFPMDRVSIIYNGLLPVKVRPRLKEELKSKYGFDPKDRIILYAGAINQRKGTYDLVSAFDKVVQETAHVRLVVAGPGDFGSIFKSTAKNWSKITVTGALDKKTLYDFYRMADIGVVPSYIEQCSYTAIEMMHYNLPLVVAKVDGLDEIIPDGCGLKVPLILGNKKAHINQGKLAEHILYFLEKPEIARQYANEAKKHALRFFSAKKMAKETIQVYEKLLLMNSPKPVLPDFQGINTLVSVVLPCHNGEKYLKACIDSVLGQTYPYFELIVVNDDSTDKTREILDGYVDKRIHVLHNEKNVGIVTSLNRGIKEAKGKYIARIDADDMMHPDRLHKQVKYLENREKEEVVLVGSHHYVINQDGKVKGMKQYPVSNAEINSVLLFQNPFSHPSIMMRADVAKRVRYSERYPYAEDFHLWFDILKDYKAGNIPECLTYYRIHEDNLSAKNNKPQRENAAALLLDELAILGLDPSLEELKIHLAISSGYGAKFFNTKEKIESVKKWIDKILLIQREKQGYSGKFMQGIKKHILWMYCGIYE